METLVIKINDSRKSEALKAVLKALDIEFEASGKSSKEAKKIVRSIKKGLDELKLIEEGKIKPKSLEEFLDEL